MKGILDILVFKWGKQQFKQFKIPLTDILTKLNELCY